MLFGNYIFRSKKDGLSLIVGEVSLGCFDLSFISMINYQG